MSSVSRLVQGVGSRTMLFVRSCPLLVGVEFNVPPKELRREPLGFIEHHSSRCQVVCIKAM